MRGLCGALLPLLLIVCLDTFWLQTYIDRMGPGGFSLNSNELVM